MLSAKRNGIFELWSSIYLFATSGVTMALEAVVSI